MESLNKENIHRFEKTVDTVVPHLCTPPVRNPLQDVNQQVVFTRSIKKPQTESLVKTPGRKIAGLRVPVSVYEDARVDHTYCVNKTTEATQIETKSKVDFNNGESLTDQNDDDDKGSDEHEHGIISDDRGLIENKEAKIICTEVVDWETDHQIVDDDVSISDINVLPVTSDLCVSDKKSSVIQDVCREPTGVSSPSSESQGEQLIRTGSKMSSEENLNLKSIGEDINCYVGLNEDTSVLPDDECSIDKCMSHVSEETNVEAIDLKPSETVTDSDLDTQICDTFDLDESSNIHNSQNEDSEVIKCSDLGCSPLETETCHSEVNSEEVTSNHVACSPIKVSVCNSETNSITVNSTDVASSPCKINTCDSHTNTDHASYEDIGCSPCKLIDTMDSGMNTSCVVYTMDSGMNTSCVVDTMDSGMNTSCVFTQDSGAQISVAVCDVSIQSVVSHSSVACSPIPNKHTVLSCVDSACSPLVQQRTEMSTMTDHSCTPVKRELGFQIEPDTVNTLSSPFMFPHKDQGVMVKPTVHDTSTETVTSIFVDQGTSVVIECSSKYTMTDSIGCDSHTSMTPVKLPNKQGRRLTAEEVRRQHPRTLANQLDTMSITNDRLQREITTVGKDRDKFKHQITELKQELKQRQNKIDELDTIEKEKEQVKDECEELKSEISNLKDELLTVKKLHSKEVEDLKAEIFRRDNSLELKSAQNLIMELNSELSEYKELAESLQSAEKMQADVKEALMENLKKVKASSERLKMMKADIDKQEAEVGKQRQENKEESERCAKEQKEILEKYENMKRTMETTRMNMMQFENLYSNTSADLLSATRQVQLLSNELTSTKIDKNGSKKDLEALQDTELTKQGLMKHVEDLEENEKSGFLEIQGLTASLNLQDKEISRLNERITDLAETSSKKVKDLQDEVHRYELLTRNLQHTLESREQDIETMEKDLFECRECIEEEREKYTNLEANTNLAYSKLNSYEKENRVLSVNCSALETECKDLRETLQSCQDELQATKMHASRLLFKQEEELKDSEVVVKELTDKMHKVISELRGKVGLEPEFEEQNKDEEPVQKKSTETKPKSTNEQSFLSLVMQAVDKKYDPSTSSSSESVCSPALQVGSPLTDSCNFSGNDSGNVSGIAKLDSSGPDSVEASPSTISRQKLGYTGSSAFAPVRTSLIKPKSGPLMTGNKSGNVVTISETSSGDSLDTQVSEDKKSDDTVTLNEQITSVCEIFKEIIRLANILEKASRFSISDLKDENEALNGQLLQLQMSEKHLKAEVEIKQNEVDQNEKQIKMLEERLGFMSENLSRFSDQESDIRNYQNEIRGLRGKLESVEAQKDLLNEQLGDIMKKQNVPSKSGSGVSSSGCQCQTEVLNLKLKLQKMREQSYKKDDYYEEIGRKASRRMRTLEENWKRAEAEVYRFDELVEIVRKKLVKNTDLIKDSSDMKYILRLIDGLESLPSKKDPLQPVKTAKW